MQSFRAARQPTNKRLYLNYRAFDAEYFDLIFFCRVEKLQYLLLRWCSHGHDIARCACTAPGTIICANFFIHFVNLTLANILNMGAQSFDMRCQNSHPVFSVSHDYSHRHLKYIMLLLHFEIFSAFTSQASSTQSIASSRLLLSCIGPMNF